MAVSTLDIIPLEVSKVSPSPSPSPAIKKIVSIEELSRQEMTELVVESNSVGFSRIGEAGVSVTRGASATAQFDITVTAVDAERLDRQDEIFQEALSASERTAFLELKANFDGGLSIPFLEFFGIDLDKTVTAEEIETLAESEENFASKSQAISEIFESVVDTQIRINGTLTATGVSRIPTVAVAFVRLARVLFDDGSSQIVVSDRNEDVLAANPRPAQRLTLPTR